MADAVVSVPLDSIRTEDYFRFRRGQLDRGHRDDITARLRGNGLALDPILLWRDEAELDAPLTLLDGEYRLEAYRRADWAGPVPATVLQCSRREALGAALRANAKYIIPLSQAERMDAAWRLVWEPVHPPFRVREVAEMANVAPRTVDNMRKRRREMEAQGITPSGEWWRDARPLAPSEREFDNMTEAQRKRAIKELMGVLRDTLDRRKHPDMPILGDSTAVDEALIGALGETRLRGIHQYLYGEEEGAYDYSGGGTGEVGDW